MALKDIDLGSVLRRLADKRIEDAMAEGKFSNLAGMGKPLDLEPMPADEVARMTWWMLRIMRNNDFVPDEVQWRKALDAIREKIARTADERELPRLMGMANELVRKINTLGTNALKAAVSPLELDAELEKRRTRKTAEGR